MIRLALHGGAGDPAPGAASDPPEHRAALARIAVEGQSWLQQGRSAVDVVERVVELLEDCPLFNAGVGAVLNADGQPELDAAIMDGRSRAGGAVTGVMRTRSPVRLARAVMERSPHVMFAGVGAEALGRELGLPEVDPAYFITDERLRQLEQARTAGVIVLDHDAAFGTVGAVARDAAGHLAAATSTGGLTNKRPGRVGDTPILGAGTYADDRSVAVSCTGTGECFIRAAAGFQIHARISYGGQDLKTAAQAALDDVREQNGRGGLIAIDNAGNVALPFNSHLMYRAWVAGDGVVRVAIGHDAQTVGGD